MSQLEGEGRPSGQALVLPLPLALLLALLVAMPSAVFLHRSLANASPAFLFFTAPPPALPQQQQQQRPPPRPAAPDHAPPYRIALLGDSITAGTVCPGVVAPLAALLEPLLGEAYEVAGFCNNGLWVTRANPLTGEPFPPYSPAVGSSPFTEHPAWPKALAYGADVYVVTLGTNDVILPWFDETSYLKDYVRLVLELQALPSTLLVAVATSPPLTLPPLSQLPAALLLPALQRNVSDATDALLIDVHAALGGPPDESSLLLCDGVHPTLEGANIIAQALAAGLQESLQQSMGWPAFSQ